MAVIATGFFDGVHLGHRHVIDALVSSARLRGEEAIVVTFGHHPRAVLQQDARTLRLLTSTEEKKALIRSLGVDRVEVLPFNREFAAMSARNYVEKVLVGRLGANYIVMGYDNKLGSDAMGPDAVQSICSDLGLDLLIVPPFLQNGEDAVSSTRIRKALEQGEVRAAADMLGYCYSLSGVVVSGNQLGRTIGFPTANMQLYDPLKLIPARGCYFTEVTTASGKYRGMTNIGVRPTIGSNESLTIETNILDFDEDIYGLDISIRFVSRIRDEIRFSSLSELRGQLEKDRSKIKAISEYIG